VKVAFEEEACDASRDDQEGAAPERERPSCIEVPVRVSGSVFCSYRASLVESGVWDSVRLGFAARLEVDPEELEQINPQSWLGLSNLQALMGAVSERFELDAIRTLMRRHIAAPQSSDFYAPMLRSWSRSFEASPGHMLRGLAPLWRAALRHAPPPSIAPVSASEVHVVLRGAGAAMLRASPALTASFEGVLLGLLDLVRPRPMLAEVETSGSHELSCSICRF
jgi:hypothetical protein